MATPIYSYSGNFPKKRAMPNLRSKALRKILKITLTAICEISKSETDDEMKIRLETVKDYISNIPRCLVREFIDLLQSYWCWIHCYYPDNAKSIVLELLLLPGVTKFQTDEWMNSAGGDLYDKLSRCSTLRTLSICKVPVYHADMYHFNNMIERLHYLQSLTLIPFDDGRSFHWAISPIAQYCLNLRELRIVYDGEALIGEARGIEQLSHCQALDSLWLLDSSYHAEPQTDKVCILLKGLGNLKFFFHRLMIPAILKLTEEEEKEGKAKRKFALEHLDTWMEIFYLDKSHEIRNEPLGLAVHKTVLCTYSLLSLVDSCPNVKNLTLGRPPSCIDRVLTTLPHICTLKLFEFQLSACKLNNVLLKDGPLRHLTVLEFTEVADLNYDFFSALADACPVLEVLKISRSCISREGQLKMPKGSRFAFPCLRELKLTRPLDLTGRDEVSRFSGVWHIGKALISYLLDCAFSISKIHIQFDDIQLEQSDIPSCEYLIEILLPLKHISSLHLVDPPNHIEEELISLLKKHSLVEKIRVDCY
nr:MAG: hypothetical protein [Penaeus monodon endogenous nimavirus]